MSVYQHLHQQDGRPTPPPCEAHSVAIKRLEEDRRDLRDEQKSMAEEIKEVKDKMTQGFADIRKDMASLETKMGSKIDTVSGDVKWILTIGGTAVTIVMTLIQLGLNYLLNHK